MTATSRRWTPWAPLAGAGLGMLLAGCGVAEESIHWPVELVWIETDAGWRGCGDCPWTGDVYGSSRDGSTGLLASGVVDYALSPDGRWLAVSQREGRFVVVSLGDGSSHEFSGSYPSWAESSDRLAFTAPDERLHTARNDGGETVAVDTDVGGAVRWSPDGRYLLVEGTTTLFDGGTGHALLDLPQTALGERERRFSPDGRWLAVLEDRNMVFVHLDDLVVQSVPFADVPPRFYPMEWSSDASTVYNGDVRNTVLVSVVTGAVSRVAGGRGAWSPVRPEMALTEDRRLVVVSTAGETLRELGTFGDSFPKWSGDGAFLAIAAASSCHVVRASDGFEVDPSGYTTCPRFGPEGFLVFEQIRDEVSRYSFGRQEAPGDFSLRIDVSSGDGLLSGGRWTWLSGARVAYVDRGTVYVAALDGSNRRPVWRADHEDVEIALPQRPPLPY